MCAEHIRDAYDAGRQYFMENKVNIFITNLNDIVLNYIF